MSDGTGIEWTDATWNPITGCSVVSPGCTNCYAMRLAGTRLAHHPSRAGLTRDTKAGPVWTGEVRFNEQWLDQPIRWKKPRRVFVCAHGDLFAEGIPDEWIDKVFAVMALAPQHWFQVLTKRPEKMRKYLSAKFARSDILKQAKQLAQSKGVEYKSLYDLPPDHVGNWPLLNVWLGVSVEDQDRADKRIPLLLDTPAAVRWISAEPLLGGVDIGRIVRAATVGGRGLATVGGDGTKPINWIVVGGESGQGARHMDPEWARSLRDQCASAGVAFFMKQMSGVRKSNMPPIPDDLMVRQWP